MRRIAISGHRDLPAVTAVLVDTAIRAALTEQSTGTVTGFSCLADGADQIFARAVLDLSGRLEVVVPAKGYREGLPQTAHADYDELFAQASAVHRLAYEESTATAHMEASTLILQKSDELYAVWDGKPARGYGGTADVVAVANQHDKPVRIIWPNGATRE